VKAKLDFLAVSIVNTNFLVSQQYRILPYLWNLTATYIIFLSYPIVFYIFVA